MLINRCHLRVDYCDAVSFMISVAKYNSPIGLPEIKKWLDENCKIIEEQDIKKYLNNVLVRLITGDSYEQSKKDK
jgi:hypothetical protein